MIFPTFFNLSLNFIIRSSLSESQSAPSFVVADCIKLYHLQLQRIWSIWFWYDHLVMSMCRVISCIVARGYLLWPVYSLGKTLLTFALLHFVPQGQGVLYVLTEPFNFIYNHSTCVYIYIHTQTILWHRKYKLTNHQSWHSVGIYWLWIEKSRHQQGHNLPSWRYWWAGIRQRESTKIASLVFVPWDYLLRFPDVAQSRKLPFKLKHLDK